MKTNYKYYYLAITIEPIKGKYYSYVLKTSDSINLASEVNGINHLRDATLMPTKKRANEVVDCWNNGYRRNGTYLLDDKEYLKNPTKYY